MEHETSFFGIYLGALLSTYFATVFLIVTKLSWGPFPHLYIQLVEYLQDNLYINKCMEVDNNNEEKICIGRKHLTPDFKENGKTSPFEMSTSLLRNGFESILEDDLSRPFLGAPLNLWSMMSWPPRNLNSTQSYSLIFVYGLSVLFRWCFLFPLRILFLLTSLVWVISCGIICSLLPVPKQLALYFGITYARLSNASLGVVTQVYNDHNRPRAPGIAVANHMTANDIMIIYGDCAYDGLGYTVTGQSHGGFIETLQKFGSHLTPTLWLNRECNSQRNTFQSQVLNYSSDPTVYPVLLFPEGYCTNNDTVLQFRKAVFTGQVPIYPIAMRQNARVGDAFWREDTYLPYVLRAMTSFAVNYDIIYLPSMNMKEGEESSEFASRVQRSIANTIGKEALPYDGGLKKLKEQLKYKEKIRRRIHEILL